MVDVKVGLGVIFPSGTRIGGVEQSWVHFGGMCKVWKYNFNNFYVNYFKINLFINFDKKYTVVRFVHALVIEQNKNFIVDILEIQCRIEAARTTIRKVSALFCKAT